MKEGESGCVLQGVISRASFRRQPRGGKSFFTVMSWHININYAKERGIGKKLLLTIRAVMPEEHVDLVAGDFNGAAWRRQCGNGRLSIIEEAFADTDLPMPQGQYQVNGPTYEDFSSLLTLMKDGKWHSMVHSPFLTIPWASVQRIKVVIMRCGCAWLSLTIMATTNRGEGMNSRKDLLRTNPTRKRAKQLKTKATVRFRHNRPYEQHGSHEHN